MKNYYTKQYFKEMDLLVSHLGESIMILMNDFNLKKVLDVGCGTGRLVKFFNQNGFEAIGCDNSEIALATAHKINKKNTIVQAPATKLPFDDQSFDLVTSIHVIEHLSETQSKKFIAESKRVIKPGGFIFLVTPNFATPLRLIQGKRWFGFKDPTHINFYTPKTLSELLKSYGFKNIKLHFKTKYNLTFDWEFPPFFSKLPQVAKKILIFIFFSTPIATIRNGFWIAAQKDEEKS